MLSKNIIQRLQSLGIEATLPSEFITGLKLMQLVLQVFYKGENPQLSTKIRLADNQKTGNSILNVNIILNHLKKDTKIALDDRIRELTAFKVIEDQDEMTRLIQWILDQQQKPNQTVYLKQEMSPPRQQQNQFENLYFVSSMQKKQQLDDSLQVQSQQQKVVRKGSFKVLKPKVSTDSKSSRQEAIKIEHFHTQTNLQDSRAKEPLKQRFIIQNNNVESDRQDLNCRKTIPKMYEKPPLYKVKHKEQKPTESRQKKESTPHRTADSTDREAILQHIQKLNKEIISQEKSSKLVPKEQTKTTQQKSRKSDRKIFKVDIAEIEDKKKKAIMQWLIGINLLNSNAAKFIDSLPSICKDGVIFLQVSNFYRGRGKQLFYFRQPKKSAEIHSNYQKLFNALAEHPDFSSSLLSQYEYFVPEAQPKAFWSFLLSIYNCYNKRVQNRQPGINRYENSLQKKVERASSKKKSQTEDMSYNEIRYNSSSLNKQSKTAFSSVQLPKRQTPKPINSRKQSFQSEQSAVKMNGPYGLVQNQEPNDQVNRGQRGYKQMYLCKFKNMQTPSKNRSFINSSLSRSRIKSLIDSSKHSSKKKEVKPTLPSITLEMQTKVIKLLNSLQIEHQSQQLFKDPYRNGLLICRIIQQTSGVQCFASRRPKSIQDCRNNFISAIEALKTHKKHFNNSYQHFIEDFIKGERSLLYGLIWEAMQNTEKQNHKSSQNTDFYNYQKQSSQQTAILWIRSVQNNYPEIGQYKIRNQYSLHSAIINTDFLFHYSCFVTGKRAISPTYERPVNDCQKQSNLKKVLGYLVHNKIIRSNYLWKTKILVKRQQNLLKQLIQELINHYNHLHIKENLKSVHFVKYLRKEDSGSKEKPIQRLETTANQTFSQHYPQPQVEQPKLEVPWMRKLGFNGNLQINNGVILCRLMAKLNMKTIERLNEQPQTRAQSLGNIRKAIKDIPKFKWDEYDILDCDYAKTLQVYAFIKDKYKHSYAMKVI